MSQSLVLSKENQAILAQIFSHENQDTQKEFDSKRVETVANIIHKADEKFIQHTCKTKNIPPKLARSLIQQASFASDKVAIDYFAGILASSFSSSGTDDRGVVMAELVDKLSVYQLRAHYLIYSTIRERFKKAHDNFSFDSCEKMELFFPIYFYAKAMKINKEERQQIHALTQHTFQGLAENNLIEPNFHFGYPNYKHQVWKGFNFDGITCQPTAIGASFFLWAFGAGKKNIEYLFHKKFCPKIKGIPVKMELILTTS